MLRGVPFGEAEGQGWPRINQPFGLYSVASVALTMLSQDNGRLSKSINFADNKKGYLWSVQA